MMGQHAETYLRRVYINISKNGSGDRNFDCDPGCVDFDDIGHGTSRSSLENSYRQNGARFGAAQRFAHNAYIWISLFDRAHLEIAMGHFILQSDSTRLLSTTPNALKVYH